MVSFAKHVIQVTSVEIVPDIGFPSRTQTRIFPMTDAALPAIAQTNSPNLGIVALIVLSLLSVMLGVSHPEAVTAEYQTIAFVGP